MKKLRSKKGQGMSEYLIILALVAIATIGAVIFFGDNLREQIANITKEIAGEQGNVGIQNTSAAKATLDGYNMKTFDTAQ